MDTEHPAIRLQLEEEDLHGRLLDRAHRAHEMFCLLNKIDPEAANMVINEERLLQHVLAEIGKITEGQREHLFEVLHFGDPPSTENQAPVFRLRFPSPDYRPPAA